MVFSPLSIHVVLSMIAAGAMGYNQDEMLSFLKSKSIYELISLASNVVPLVFADGSQSGGPRLSFANGGWIDESVSIKPSFEKVMHTNYKAALKQVDFKTKPEKVRSEVNSWGKKETDGLIKSILPRGLVSSETRLILANAQSLHVSHIFHKAFIGVDEKGTEAAAVTAACAEMYCLIESPPQIDFVADHPFLYLITEEVTKTVMFIGQVLNPIED